MNFEITAIFQAAIVGSVIVLAFVVAAGWGYGGQQEPESEEKEDWGGWK